MHIGQGYIAFDEANLPIGEAKLAFGKASSAAARLACQAMNNC